MTKYKNETEKAISATVFEDLSRLHTTERGADRIRKNLRLSNVDAVEYCKNAIADKNCRIYKRGKNYYCENNGEIFTVNSYSFTIITAHKI